MEKLNSTQRKFLRGKAHALKPIVIIGYQGLSETVIQTIQDVLEEHELIKVKFNKFKEEKKELSAKIEEGTNSHLVGLIGNVAIFYKQNPDKDKRKVRFS